MGTYENGTHGGNASSLAPKLMGMTVSEIEQVLDVDAAAGRCTRMPRTSVGKPMLCYLYRDGTLVRIKPEGSCLTPAPMYSIEVTKEPGICGTQDDVAFKVDSDGRPTPKAPQDLRIPPKYMKHVNPYQYAAFCDEALRFGYQLAKSTPRA